MLIAPSLVTWHTVKFELGRSVRINVQNGRCPPPEACQLPSWSPPCQAPESQRLMLALEEHFAEWPPTPVEAGAVTSNGRPWAPTAVRVKPIILLLHVTFRSTNPPSQQPLGSQCQRLARLARFRFLVTDGHSCCLPQGSWITMADEQEKDLQKFLKNVDEISKYQ